MDIPKTESIKMEKMDNTEKKGPKKKMELDESSHILDHQVRHHSDLQTHLNMCLQLQKNSHQDYHIPDTPESSKSDLHQLIEDSDDEKDNKNRSSLPMASFNFINSIIGSGIIGMPYAFKEAGFGMGILLVLLVTVVTDYSLVLLIHGGELSNTNTYQDVMRAAFGRTGFIILTVMQFLYPMIAMISYNVIIGDTITKIVIRIGGPDVVGSIIASREFVIIAVTLLITLPLSLYRNIARLSKFSFISLIFLMFLMSVVTFRTFNFELAPTPDAWTFANTGITRAIGIMAFAYMCHHNSFLIYDSLIEPTEKRWTVVTHVSVVFSMACTLVLAITGYATFTGHTQGDVLENYCHRDDLVNVARFLFACTIMLTYPIECFVTREVVENAVFAFKQPPPLWRHVAMTFGIVLMSVILSMATDCLGIVLELNGVLNAAPLAYIFPALCVMKLQNDRLLCWKNIPMLATATFGVLVSVIGLIMAIIEMASGVECSHGEELSYCLSPSVPGGGNHSMYTSPHSSSFSNDSYLGTTPAT